MIKGRLEDRAGAVVVPRQLDKLDCSQVALANRNYILDALSIYENKK